MINDPREELSDYHKVDVNLIASDLIEGLELSLAVKNLFDDDIREPSPGPAIGSNQPDITEDLPHYKRSLWFSVKYDF